MKSGKAEIYRPPGGRTERDVAAEGIARLLKGGVLARSPAVVAHAAAVVGVPVALVREKWAIDGLAIVPFDGTLVAQDQPVAQDQEPSTVSTVSPLPARPATAQNLATSQTTAAHNTPKTPKTKKRRA